MNNGTDPCGSPVSAGGWIYICKNDSMKRLPALLISLFAFVIFSSNTGCAQNPVNWTPKQLMEPAMLASDINANKDLPLIINVGPAPTIPHSQDIGSTKEKEGQDLLVARLKNIPKDRKIVIYCGCCPFEHCPNVRPAINVLKQLNFTNYYLLNLPHNIKTDWIDKGFPVNKL